MASTEPVEAEPEYDEMEDDMMGPLPVSKMEVRSTCVIPGVWHIRCGLQEAERGRLPYS